MGALRNERTVRNRRPVCLGARRRNVRPSGPCLCTGAWPDIARLPAASLLEAVVASVVLLIVFAASLETDGIPVRGYGLRGRRLPGRLHSERNPAGGFL